MIFKEDGFENWRSVLFLILTFNGNVGKKLVASFGSDDV